MITVDINAKPIQNGKYLGTHLICEYFECDAAVLDDIAAISEALISAAAKCGVTVLQKSFHKFSPQGVSGVVVIAESHISIHTWPENNYAAVDFFTCSDICDVNIAADYLKKIFKSKKTAYMKIKRGQKDK